MAEQVAARHPNATLVKNDVGNLSIIDAGEYAGWLDLGSGEVDFFADTDTP
ncbi:hypothetical protein [Nocardia sp. N2S4-5]|uniref:hypothetical protein n=1 Tax=Nocardia sp. N2S4-5 TaxID=3351565 RepID=UPI0037D8771C